MPCNRTISVTSLTTQQTTLFSSLRCSDGRGLEWVKHVVSPPKHVVFFDTDSLREQLEKKSELRTTNSKNARPSPTNEKEVEIVARIVASLVNVNVPLSSVGIISPYR